MPDMWESRNAGYVNPAFGSSDEDTRARKDGTERIEDGYCRGVSRE